MNRSTTLLGLQPCASPAVHSKPGRELVLDIELYVHSSSSYRIRTVTWCFCVYRTARRGCAARVHVLIGLFVPAYIRIHALQPGTAVCCCTEAQAVFDIQARRRNGICILFDYKNTSCLHTPVTRYGCSLFCVMYDIIRMKRYASTTCRLSQANRKPRLAAKKRFLSED